MAFEIIRLTYYLLTYLLIQLPHGKGHSSAPHSKSAVHVYCGQTAGWIKMKLGMEIGLGLRQIVKWGPSSPPQRDTSPNFHEDSAPPSPKGHSPQFLAHACCGQTAGWIKMPFGSEVGLGPGHIVLDGDQLPSPEGEKPHIFGPCLLWPNGRPSQLLLSTC